MADFDSLLDELRAVRADRQRIPSYSVADTAVLVDGIEQLRARVVDLEAQQGEQTGIEWGVRLRGLDHSGKSWGENEQGARRRVASFPDGRAELINRTAAGPWRVSS